MASTAPVILYGYNQSPFYQKMLLILQLKKIEYSVVHVERMPPRPQLSSRVSLGITYRRIPVLAIGNDVYIDTAAAVQALEKAFPAVSLSLDGLAIGTAAFWPDRAIFSSVAGLLPPSTWSPEFVKDRSAFSGNTLDPAKFVAARPLMLSQLRVHVNLLETQLRMRKGTYLNATPEPTFIDISFYFVLQWTSTFGTADSIFKSGDFPLVEAWLATMQALHNEAKALAPNGGKPIKISAVDAAKAIHASPALTKDALAAINDDKEPLLTAGWFKIGQEVSVTPDDSGRVPQNGTLAAINAREIVISVANGAGATVMVHCPRIGFKISAVKASKL